MDEFAIVEVSYIIIKFIRKQQNQGFNASTSIVMQSQKIHSLRFKFICQVQAEVTAFRARGAGEHPLCRNFFVYCKLLDENRAQPIVVAWRRQIKYVAQIRGDIEYRLDCHMPWDDGNYHKQGPLYGRFTEYEIEYWFQLVGFQKADKFQVQIYSQDGQNEGMLAFTWFRNSIEFQPSIRCNVCNKMFGNNVALHFHQHEKHDIELPLKIPLSTKKEQVDSEQKFYQDKNMVDEENEMQHGTDILDQQSNQFSNSQTQIKEGELQSYQNLEAKRPFKKLKNITFLCSRIDNPEGYQIQNKIQSNINTTSNKLNLQKFVGCFTNNCENNIKQQNLIQSSKDTCANFYEQNSDPKQIPSQAPAQMNASQQVQQVKYFGKSVKQLSGQRQKVQDKELQLQEKPKQSGKKISIQYLYQQFELEKSQQQDENKSNTVVRKLPFLKSSQDKSLVNNQMDEVEVIEVSKKKIQVRENVCWFCNEGEHINSIQGAGRLLESQKYVKGKGRGEKPRKLIFHYCCAMFSAGGDPRVSISPLVFDDEVLVQRWQDSGVNTCSQCSKNYASVACFKGDNCLERHHYTCLRRLGKLLGDRNFGINQCISCCTSEEHEAQFMQLEGLEVHPDEFYGMWFEKYYYKGQGTEEQKKEAFENGRHLIEPIPPGVRW